MDGYGSRLRRVSGQLLQVERIELSAIFSEARRVVGIGRLLRCLIDLVLLDSRSDMFRASPFSGFL